jgi:hypothetical protein
MPAYKAGSDIDAWCTKCQLDLAHVIIAMVGARPVRVQCKTCRSVHAYKRGADMKDKAKAKTPRTPGAKASAGRGEYDKLMAGRDIARARRYRPADTFAAGDVVDHPTFGLGVVTKLLDGGKVDVAFQAGAKTLVHARAASSG